MAELNERETKIVHILLTLLSYKLEGVPFDLRKNMLIMTLKLRNIEFNEDEITDLVNAINEEQSLITKNALGFLDKHNASLGMLKDLKL